MRHDARQNLHRVRFLPLGGEARLSGTAAIEIVLDVLLGQRQQWRAAIDHTANRDPVAFAKGRDPEHVTEGVKGHWDARWIVNADLSYSSGCEGSNVPN